VDSQENHWNCCYQVSYFTAEMQLIRFRRGSAPDPAGGAHYAPPDPVVGWGEGYPLPIPHPSTPLASRSRCLWRRNQSIPGSAFSVIRPLGQNILYTVWDRIYCLEAIAPSHGECGSASLVGVWRLCPSGIQGQSLWSGVGGEAHWSWK